jgi:hypothetical protein
MRITGAGGRESVSKGKNLPVDCDKDQYSHEYGNESSRFIHDKEFLEAERLLALEK